MKYDLSIIFTGHMVDLPGRLQRRFPQSMASVVATEITQAVERARGTVRGPVLGLSSAARGGDILFQEACRLHGIETRVVLPCAAEEFVESSVDGVPDSDWVDRFRAVWHAAGATGRTVLSGQLEEAAYERCNEALLSAALETGRSAMLLAFWNGQQGDAPGGTATFVQRVRSAGGAVEIIDADRLLRGHAAL